MLLLLLLVAGVTNTLAQDVTIRGNNGSTIPARKNGGATDTFFGLGGFATWQHEQLSMVLTVSDGTRLTQYEQLDNPANNLFVSADGEKIQIAKGQFEGSWTQAAANVCYVSLSLPKGYRFTQYIIEFSKPQNAQGGEFNTANNERSTFGETGKDFGNYITSASIVTNGEVQKITRNESTGGKMGNVLYFKLEDPDDSRALIQLENAKFYFTAEENYSPVLPAGTINNRSAVDIPFSTSKVDYGPIENVSYQGYDPRYSYSSAAANDVTANFVLYEAESLDNNGTNFDGVQGKVVKYQTGSINSEAGYFKLGGVKENNQDKEQVYYIETPTYVELSNGKKNPVGYRIIGAEFDFGKKIVKSRTFHITYTLDGTKYYLCRDFRGNLNWNSDPDWYDTYEWSMDDEGYISCTTIINRTFYLYFNNGYAALQSGTPEESERFSVSEDGIYQKGWSDYFIRFYQENGTYYCLISKDEGENASYEKVEETSVGTGTTDFSFYVYDQTGATEDKVEHKINDANPMGHVTLSGLNNDAVKFGVKGVGLFTATLTLQALDPYLEKMDVVCTDKATPAIRMKQTFDASDFSVNGGEFYFYVPEGTEDVKITFENLKSKYFDESYTGGSTENKSRINFVKSAHYNAFGGTTEGSENIIYNDRAEARNAELDRLTVSVVGSAPFEFNNAEEVGENGGTLTEYPFTLAKYKASPNNGNFGVMEYEDITEDEQVDTRYVFTTDETRYNIAPTTATQHRAYAFYKMIVHVQTHFYSPKIKFTKIYNNTLYRDDNNKVQRDPFYSVEVTAPYVVDGKEKQGYAGTDEIFAGINRILTEDKVDDFGNTDIPKSAKQILNLDFSKLEGIYQITTAENPDMQSYSNSNAANCLIFLPVGANAPNDNVASKISETSNTFKAANNIKLTDMQPFYSPYDIEVDPVKNVEYSRKITKASYGQETTCTVILPFNILVQDGKHKNLDGSEFTLHKMQATNSLVLKDGTTYAYMPSAFGNVTETTEQNKPYIVKLENVYSEDPNLSFVVTQKGATIKATAGIMNSNYTITDKDAEGNIITSEGTAIGGDADPTGTTTGTKYTFTNKGTYAGIEIAKGQEVFYFARNNFVCSKSLSDNYSTVKVAPFRAFYTWKADGPAKLMNFDLIFGEGLGDTPTGINSLGMNPDLQVVPGNGMITLTSTIEQNVRVHSTSGVLVNNAKMQAGETQTIHVPAGVYVINGVKIIVK